MSLLKKFGLIAVSLFLLSFVVKGTSYAYIAGCCNDGDPVGRMCGAVPAGGCPTGTNVCDQDLNNDAEGYNSNCYIPISAPSEVKITDFGRLFSGAVSFLLLIAFILAFFYLILGGISWLTSGGDKANIETARNKIIAAILGLIIVAATWAIFQLIGGAIGFNILGGFELPTLF